MAGGERAAPLILVVEDDDSVAELYQFVLASAGYRVARAKNGAEALVFEEELAPDLLLLDVHMPILDGLDVLRHRDATRKMRTPAIVTSADPASEPPSLAAGAVLFLPKPLASAELLAAIEGTLGRADITPEARRARTHRVVDEYVRDGERRQHLLARLDPNDPELQRRVGALVAWLAGYYEMDAVWVDVLHGESVLVEAAFSRPSARGAYDVVRRVLISENIANAHSPFLVGDLQSTPWFGTHPAVRAGYRFLAGAPLRGPDQVGLGALCIAGVQPRAFDAANLAVLQHCGTEFGHRIAHLAGAAVSGPFLFDTPSVFSADTMDVLVTAELLRARRRRTAFELALVRLIAPGANRVARCAEAVQRAVEGRGCAVANHSPTVFAVLVRGDNVGDTRARMDAALHALRMECFEEISVAGVVAHAGAASGTLSVDEVFGAADAVLASVPPDTWMRRATLAAEGPVAGAT